MRIQIGVLLGMLCGTLAAAPDAEARVKDRRAAVHVTHPKIHPRLLKTAPAIEVSRKRVATLKQVIARIPVRPAKAAEGLARPVPLPFSRQQANLPLAACPDRAFRRPVIVIDPGHGGRDPGAVGVAGTLEKSVTLATALELRRVLEATGSYRVALTRTDDRTVTLADRLDFAREQDADLLIAVHADASADRTARGASVYVRGNGTTSLPETAGNAKRIARALAAPDVRPESASAELQSSMIEQLADDVLMVSEPARAARLWVLASPKMPGVLIEMGFLSNPGDEALLRQHAHRRVLVVAIRDAIEDYFATMKATRTQAWRDAATSPARLPRRSVACERWTAGGLRPFVAWLAEFVKAIPERFAAHRTTEGATENN